MLSKVEGDRRKRFIEDIDSGKEGLEGGELLVYRCMMRERSEGRSNSLRHSGQRAK